MFCGQKKPEAAVEERTGLTVVAVDLVNPDRTSFPVLGGKVRPAPLSSVREGTSFSVLTVFSSSPVDMQAAKSEVGKVRARDKTVFIMVFVESGRILALDRFNLFQLGCNMVTDCHEASGHVLSLIERQETERARGGRKVFICPFCGMQDLSEEILWRHCPLYHVDRPNERQQPCTACPVASNALQVHIHEDHRPKSAGPSDAQIPPQSLHSFALVVVRHPTTKRFLLVQEFAQSGFWLPGGRVDGSERLEKAAIRETMEEAGVEVELKGLFRVEYSPKRGYSRMRVIFYAEPKDLEAKPKSIPDFESAGAAWVSEDELHGLPLRGGEPAQWICYLSKGGQIFPLSVLTLEGAPAMP
uniref:Nudix hydrolase domain-containing protein n=1 Tax=Chromera velia CCMP2878 TaxID=1169474 RepID=A0A0G4HET8_9ALVE|eukprot:Cvel_26876.t1-p1 / transcript=Cvel_26876.t1 / gene=Cvel_26876 / organism=Chromera_velia_CCMP2878 / gene_product=Putative 8-oxo-dGTP diphosphatase 3, putative / transcript_product=Putative 8-oxo-dGTP diphosphatase 3, putative / location=Cvel_scaffold3265:1213-6239(+) / protein_length=356 / sequence_SO=supercontig / SO=protein_coding / is_pseudo=false